ncbi:MAG: DUF1653 domain-containing protein [Lachnospiraceae bacterium]|nr:DUF1653 domain-containing protein [Lachnospiraceae bacterium]
MVRSINCGEVYRHFKGNYYKILALAKDSSDLSDVVVYQALYGNGQIYTRSMSEFLSEVDRNKYPEAVQRYRFEVVNGEMRDRVLEFAKMDAMYSNNSDDSIKFIEFQTAVEKDSVSKDAHEFMDRFFDAKTYKSKFEVLRMMWYENLLTDNIIDTLAVSVDCALNEEDLESRYDSLSKYLNAQSKYEILRDKN